MLVPPCADGAHVCAPEATTAQATCPASVIVMAPGVGFVAVALPPLAASKWHEPPAIGCAASTVYLIVCAAVFGMVRVMVPVGNGRPVCFSVRYQTSADASGVVAAIWLVFACVIV